MLEKRSVDGCDFQRLSKGGGGRNALDDSYLTLKDLCFVLLDVTLFRVSLGLLGISF